MGQMERETGIEPATNGLEGRALERPNTLLFSGLLSMMASLGNLIENLRTIQLA